MRYSTFSTILDILTLPVLSNSLRSIHLICAHFNKQAYSAHSIGLHLRYSRAHGIGLCSHAHGIGSSRSCLDKGFLHLRGTDIHAVTKV